MCMLTSASGLQRVNDGEQHRHYSFYGAVRLVRQHNTQHLSAPRRDLPVLRESRMLCDRMGHKPRYIISRLVCYLTAIWQHRLWSNENVNSTQRVWQTMASSLFVCTLVKSTHTHTLINLNRHFLDSSLHRVMELTNWSSQRLCYLLNYHSPLVNLLASCKWRHSPPSAQPMKRTEWGNLHSQGQSRHKRRFAPSFPAVRKVAMLDRAANICWGLQWLAIHCSSRDSSVKWSVFETVNRSKSDERESNWKLNATCCRRRSGAIIKDVAVE